MKASVTAPGAAVTWVPPVVEVATVAVKVLFDGDQKSSRKKEESAYLSAETVRLFPSVVPTSKRAWTGRPPALPWATTTGVPMATVLMKDAKVLCPSCGPTCPPRLRLMTARLPSWRALEL